MVREGYKRLVSELFFAAQEIPKLTHLVLYGSVSRGEDDRRSDIDLLLVFDSDKDPEKTDIAAVAHEKIGKAFADAGCEKAAQLTFTNLKNIDSSFLERIAREGIIIWGKPLVLSDKILKPKVLFEYKVGGGSRPEKVKFYRAVRNINAKKIKSGILVDEGNVEDAEKIFKLNRIEYRKSRIWI